MVEAANETQAIIWTPVLMFLRLWWIVIKGTVLAGTACNIGLMLSGFYTTTILTVFAVLYACTTVGFGLSILFRDMDNYNQDKKRRNAGQTRHPQL